MTALRRRAARAATSSWIEARELVFGGLLRRLKKTDPVPDMFAALNVISEQSPASSCWSRRPTRSSPRTDAGKRARSWEEAEKALGWLASSARSSSGLRAVRGGHYLICEDTFRRPGADTVRHHRRPRSRRGARRRFWRPASRRRLRRSSRSAPTTSRRHARCSSYCCAADRMCARASSSSSRGRRHDRAAADRLLDRRAPCRQHRDGVALPARRCPSPVPREGFVTTVRRFTVRVPRGPGSGPGTARRGAPPAPEVDADSKSDGAKESGSSRGSTTHAEALGEARCDRRGARTQRRARRRPRRTSASAVAPCGRRRASRVGRAGHGPAARYRLRRRAIRDAVAFSKFGLVLPRLRRTRVLLVHRDGDEDDPSTSAPVEARAAPASNPGD